MNQKMIHCLPTMVTHTTPIHNRKTSSPQIVTSEYLPSRQSKQKRKPEGKMTKEDPLNAL